MKRPAVIDAEFEVVSGAPPLIDGPEPPEWKIRVAMGFIILRWVLGTIGLLLCAIGCVDVLANGLIARTVNSWLR